MDTILVIGAVALDRPIWLEGPSHPGARVRARSLDGSLEGRLGGGAANAGCALVAAGHEVTVASLFAQDADGERARALAAAAGLDLTPSRTRAGASGRTLLLIEPTGERTIIGLDGAFGVRPAVGGPADHPKLRPVALFIRSAYAGAAEWAAAMSGPVVLHWPAPGYAGAADIVVASADDLPADVAAAPFAAAASLFGPRLRWVVVTHGADGVVAHGPEGQVSVAAPPAVVRDATGAGDVFAAGLVDALASGAEIERALAHACAWGAAAVTMEGSALPGGAFPPFAGQGRARC